MNQVTTNGSTPLWIASNIGHVDLIKLIIEAGGDVNQAINQADANGTTPLGAASRDGHTEIVRLLLQQPNIDVNKGAERWSPLALANYGNHADIIQLLTNAGAK